MNVLRNWFTPAMREKLYTAIAALAPILVTAGAILPGQVEPIMAIVAAALQGFGGLLALINLKPTEAARWFGTVGRGIIYTGATGVAAAVVALGAVTDDWATGALTYVSFGLTALAAILAVVTPKEVSVDISEIPLKVEAAVVDNAIVTPVVESHTETADEVVIPVISDAAIEATAKANATTITGVIPAKTEDL